MRYSQEQADKHDLPPTLEGLLTKVWHTKGRDKTGRWRMMTCWQITAPGADGLRVLVAEGADVNFARAILCMEARLKQVIKGCLHGHV